MASHATRIFVSLGALSVIGAGTVMVACSSDSPPRRTTSYTNETGPRPCPRPVADAGGQLLEDGSVDAASDAGAAAIDGSATGDGGAVVPSDAGASEPDCEDAGAGTKVRGEVTAVQGQGTPGDVSTSYRRLEAGFEATTRRDCTTYEMEACTALVCTDEIDAGPPPINANVPNVGRIDVNGSLGSESLRPLGNGTYPTIDKLANPFWGTGTTLRFIAQGSTSGPSFDGSVSAPSTLEVTAPPIPGTSAPLVVNRLAPLPIAWNQVAIATTIEIVIRTANDKARLTCVYPSSAPQNVQIPSAALFRLPEGGASFAIYSTSETTLDRPDSVVRIAAKTPAIQGQRSFRIAATLQ